MNLIEACDHCGTFCRIPIEDLYEMGISDNICHNCLKILVDIDDKEGIIGDVT